MNIAFLLPSWNDFLEDMRKRFNLVGLARADWLNAAKREQLLRMIGRWRGPGAMYYAAARVQGVMFDNSGTFHYRVGLPMKWLARAGWHHVSRVADLDRRTMNRHDVIVIPRGQNPELAREIDRRRAEGARARIVYECDDWVFAVPPSNPARGAIDPVGVAEVIRVADAITVTTDALAARFRRAFPGKPVFVLPNCVDFDFWPDTRAGGHEIRPCEFKAAPRNGEKVRIVWAGSATHNNDFREIGRALNTLKGSRALLGRRAEFAVLGDAPRDIVKSFCDAPLGFRLPRVNIDDYWKTFAALEPDICVAPLNAVTEPDRSFNACKSNIKYLEAAAAGACSVATTIETYAVEPNDGCALCRGAAEWTDALARLILDDEYRADMRRRAFECVRRNWNMADKWRMWEQAYEAIAAGGHAPFSVPAGVEAVAATGGGVR
ncbi:MAG TPA: glycosyltransferase [Candidatus Brocadiia bacterium]|nr:glycosyltransferase [Candidatus Brocadiia bacterium]